MNILFLTLIDFSSFSEWGIYTDLLRALAAKGHTVYAVSPVERRTGKRTHLIREEEGTILKLRIGNIQKTNIIEKGISTLRVESLFIKGIKRHFGDVRFDLVLYSTPPITLCSAVEFIKKRDGARTYLLLKDIFPQNAVDMGMLRKSGPKGVLYRLFRRKEKRLYAISDRIGCMSEANCRYLLSQDPQIAPERVEICPNSVEPRDLSISVETRRALREKYGIPQDKAVFVYGGNLGKPQGVDFIMQCLEGEAENDRAFFLIVGDGTEYGRLSAFLAEKKLPNVKLLSRLPREDYDRMVAACDVGLIFLDHRFLIPNFPSRLLSYMQAGIPVLAATDKNTDVGRVITEGKFGAWCESNDRQGFSRCVAAMLDADRAVMGERGRAYLEAHFTVQ
ncbi:MAG: glycosyltransferase family 4 protein, partial [Clostridia bacterium]|nr:glycosyltransferase family 4 protein [Clostridia bacterium]